MPDHGAADRGNERDVVVFAEMRTCACILTQLRERALPPWRNADDAIEGGMTGRR